MINSEAKQDIVLKVTDLTVELDNEIVLEDVCFELGKDDVVAILGPNGAGKTVLLKALLGLLPYRGTVAWAPDTRVGYVPQRLPFIKDIPLSVREFFGLKRVSRSELNEIVNAVGFSEKSLDKKIGTLSSGQFQRILIGWAMVSRPQVLLFDEPTTGVDIGGQESIYQLLAKLSRERELTILLVTHDLSVVSDLATRCICLNRKMICDNIPEKLTPECFENLHHSELKFHKHNHG